MRDELLIAVWRNKFAENVLMHSEQVINVTVMTNSSSNGSISRYQT